MSAVTSQGKANEYLQKWDSSVNAVRATTVQEDFFALGRSFSFEDYFTMGASEVMNIVVDPTAFVAPMSGQDRIVFNPLIASSTAGPITIEFYANTTASNNGTELGASNRDATSSNTPMLVLRQNPTITDAGTRFAGDLIPSTGVSPATATGADATTSLPFAINTKVKYMIRFTNEDGADVKMQIKLNWFEI
jgi:hypothetical protein